jgi:hypothetical protein
VLVLKVIYEIHIVPWLKVVMVGHKFQISFPVAMQGSYACTNNVLLSYSEGTSSFLCVFMWLNILFSDVFGLNGMRPKGLNITRHSTL